MHLYLDESIHDQHGFMLVAYILCDKDPQDDLAAILATYQKSEFHACEDMAGNTRAQALRREYIGYINLHCKWGVMVFPSNKRFALLPELGEFIHNVICAHTQNPTLSVFLDEGLIKPPALSTLIASTGISDIQILKSHDAHGIQLADLVAAFCGIQLREALGGSAKILSYGSGAGFDPPIDAPLGSELWAALRYSMLLDCNPIGYDLPEMATFATKGYGLLVSHHCPSLLRSSAEKLFGHAYLGCMH